MSSNILDKTLNPVQDVLAAAGINLSSTAIITTLVLTLIPPLLFFYFVLSQHDPVHPPPAGCRKIGLKGRSNLYDQHSKKYARGGTRTPSNPWTVKALFIYPIKSCAPVEVDKSNVFRTGLKYDRQFALGQYVTSLPSLDGKVDSEWHFMTQRKFPRLAKVETEVWVPDPSAPGYKPDGEWVMSGGCIVVRFPFSPDSDFTLEGLRNYGKIMAAKLAGKSEPTLEFRLPFDPPKDRMKKKGYTSSVLRIWKDAPEALDMSSEIDPEILAKLRYTLGTSNPITIFRTDATKRREVYKNAPKKEEVGFQTSIAMQDSYPVHILNLASVHDVASKLPRKPPPNHMQSPLLNALRFRANIYITGPPAFHEDDWRKTRIASTIYDVCCRTTRCKLPNVDPETGEADRNEPSTTLRQYRVIDEGSKSACLGMMITPLEDGEIKIGDTVELLETGAHRFDSGTGQKADG